MDLKLKFFLSFFIISFALHAQVSIHSTPIHIASGTVLGIKGNLISDQPISGEGKIRLNGTDRQLLNLSNQFVSNLEIENNSGVDLLSDAKINTNLTLTNGKLNLNNYDLYLSDSAIIFGGDSTNFITNDGTGQVFKSINNDLHEFELPIGNTNSFRPLFLTTIGNYSNGYIAAKSIDSSVAEKPIYIIDYINNYWKINQSGINGSINISAQYNATADVVGNNNNIKGHYFNGTDWAFSTTQVTPDSHHLFVPVTSPNGIIYGMNSFVYLGSKSMLEAAYDSSTGLMNDKLRWPIRYIPLDDPYRISPYDVNFHHVNNSFAESINSNILSDQSSLNDNIIDWVFIELRNNRNVGNNVISTRSALLQRDGDIVDIDGKSPVFFNYVEDGNYSLSVRHRNHLAISLNPSYSAHITENKTAAFTNNLIDFTALPASNIFGTSEGFTTTTHPSLNSIRLMKAGNANGNENLRYSGYSNDRATILYDLNNNESGIRNGYYRSDLNMDGKVDYLGNNTDKYFLLHQILHNDEIKIIKQELPQ